MSAPDMSQMPALNYAIQSQGDATTLLSWLGIDVTSEAGGADGSSSSDGQGGGSAAPPPDMNSMPGLQLALQTNGDANYLMSMLGHDVTNEQAQA